VAARCSHSLRPRRRAERGNRGILTRLTVDAPTLPCSSYRPFYATGGYQIAPAFALRRAPPPVHEHVVGGSAAVRRGRMFPPAMSWPPEHRRVLLFADHPFNAPFRAAIPKHRLVFPPIPYFFGFDDYPSLLSTLSLLHPTLLILFLVTRKIALDDDYAPTTARCCFGPRSHRLEPARELHVYLACSRRPPAAVRAATGRAATSRAPPSTDRCIGQAELRLRSVSAALRLRAVRAR